MVRLEKLLEPLRERRRRRAPSLAAMRVRSESMVIESDASGRPVRVDHEPRVVVQNQERVEARGEPPS